VGSAAGGLMSGCGQLLHHLGADSSGTADDYERATHVTPAEPGVHGVREVLLIDQFPERSGRGPFGRGYGGVGG
jgi:hypothetical protein